MIRRLIKFFVVSLSVILIISSGQFCYASGDQTGAFVTTDHKNGFLDVTPGFMKHSMIGACIQDNDWLKKEISIQEQIIKKLKDQPDCETKIVLELHKKITCYVGLLKQQILPPDYIIGALFNFCVNTDNIIFERDYYENVKAIQEFLKMAKKYGANVRSLAETLAPMDRLRDDACTSMSIGLDKFFGEYYYGGNTYKELAYKNLIAVEANTPKIPEEIIYVWLTSENKPREISEKNINNVIRTKNIMQNWNFTLWTNDKALIPKSIEKLEANGIRVRTIAEIAPNLRLHKEIMQLLKKDYLGPAIDILKYSLVNALGGVCVDLNFIFEKPINKEVYKYDFFMPDCGFPVENSCLAARSNHPILNTLLNYLEDVFYDPLPCMAKIMLTINQHNMADFLTWRPLTWAYIKSAHSNGNIDVIIPKMRVLIEESGESGITSEVNSFTCIVKKGKDGCVTFYWLDNTNNSLEINKKKLLLSELPNDWQKFLSDTEPTSIKTKTMDQELLKALGISPLFDWYFGHDVKEFSWH